MAIDDVDAGSSSIVVRLKGARDAHRVPVTDDFWPVWQRYLVEERQFPETPAAWLGQRRGAGRPLSYGAFESTLRYTARKVGVRVHAHMFRHTLAQAVADTAGLKVAQELLGHRNISTTANAYLWVDDDQLATAVARARDLVDLPDPPADSPRGWFVFDYAPDVIAELEALSPRSGPS